MAPEKKRGGGKEEKEGNKRRFLKSQCPRIFNRSKSQY
jgi:hypothetical protein